MSLDATLAYASISEIGKLYRRRKLSPVELTQFLLDRIGRLNPRLNAYLTLNPKSRSTAQPPPNPPLQQVPSQKSSRGPRPAPRHPYLAEDNLHTAGLRTTGGSAFLRDFLPLEDAAVVTSLKIPAPSSSAKQISTNLLTASPATIPTSAPSAIPGIRIASPAAPAEVPLRAAAGLCYGSIGTDTGGSVRIPASLCGVVGLKPGLGRISTEGAIPLSATLDFVGPMARTVTDVALLFEAIATARVNQMPATRLSRPTSSPRHSQTLLPRRRQPRHPARVRILARHSEKIGSQTEGSIPALPERN